MVGQAGPDAAIPRPEPTGVLRRARLEGRLREALVRRLTTVVAEAGYGKSTLLAAWSVELNCAWYGATAADREIGTLARGLIDALRLRVPGLPSDLGRLLAGSLGPDAEADDDGRAHRCAAMLCESLAAELQRELVLVVDDVHELAGSAAAHQLLEGLVRQAPPALHVVLASRGEPPFPIDRLRGQGQVLELASVDLAFTPAETEALVADRGVPAAEAAAVEIQRATAGWPAAVVMAAESLRGVPAADRTAALERVRRPDGPLFAYLASEVLGRGPERLRELVRTVAPLERFTPALCEALGIAGAADLVAALARRGAFVEQRVDEAGWYTLNSLVREVALARLPLDDGERRRVLASAALWLRERGHTTEALRALAAIGDRDEIVALLDARGAELLAGGAVAAIIDALDTLDADALDAGMLQLAGDALQVRGNWDAALRCFERAAGASPRLTAALAWRMGLIYQLRGRLEDALALYDRADEDGASPRDLALLLAWRGAAHWLGARADECRRDAERAHEIALASGDPQALAAAHTVLAMLAALEGERAANDAHYLRALDYAEAAGDVLQVIRIRSNRGSRHLEEGAYVEAIAELDLALRLADVAGFALFRALALTNRGEARLRLGWFEDAIADLELGRDLYQRLDSRLVAYPLERLAAVHRERGDMALARAEYEEAIGHAEAAGDVQGLVPALAGLARVLADDDPDEAERCAARACELGGMGQVEALLAAGWVAFARNDREQAAGRAAAAAAAARGRRDWAGLAESIELEVLATPEPAAQRHRLDEAGALWAEMNSPLGGARVAVVAAVLSGRQAEATAAQERLARLGARGSLAELQRLLPRAAAPPLAIQTLGRFRVARNGEPVPLAAWQSRKARDLLKLLVARRGRPVPRDMLMEELWPEQDPAQLGSRLSVLLSTVRGVLDPDKRFSADHFVAASPVAAWVQLEHVEVDVERFLARAAAALAGLRAGDQQAGAALADAELLYAGTFLEESIYDDWTVELREEARATYIELVRALASDAAQRHDADAATRYYRRVLVHDAYDEQAHLGLVGSLVAAGRHGEARRCFQTYCLRMRDIGVESAPFPAAA